MPHSGGQKISRAEWARIQAMAARFREAHAKAIPAPAPRKPWIFGYRRCSHVDSVRSGLGLEEQADRIEAYTRLLLTEHKDCEVGPQYEDPATSAWKIPFRRRKEAGKMLEKMRSGDHLVFAEFDRAFRNTRDCLDTLDYLKKRGIHVHFADLRLDLETAVGELVITVMAGTSQMEARHNSDRSKAVSARLKTTRGWGGGTLPPGFMWTGPKGKRQIAHCPRERQIMARIVEMRDGPPQLQWTDISDRLEEELAKEEHRAPRPVGFGRPWGPNRCATAYRYETHLRKLEAKGSNSKPVTPPTLRQVLASLKRTSRPPE